jgi:hypothetical protein
MTVPVKSAGLALLAAAGCTTTPDPYAVDAVARLAPVAGAGVVITGDIEVLAPATPIATFDSARTLVAYKVALPGGAAPWVRILRTASCDPDQSRPALFADVGALRRVGDQTHFFARDILIGDGTRDVDINTVMVENRHSSLVGMVVVLQMPAPQGTAPEPPPEPDDCPGDRDAPNCPAVTWTGFVAGGPWLACAPFETL